MAGSDSGGNGQARQLPSLAAPISKKLSTPLSRRQWALIAITASLHVLLWSSVFAFVVAVYLIAADPSDTTTIPTVVLTLSSSLASMAYTVLHTIFSLKQRIWMHQRAHPSIIKRTSYIAIRVTVTLCILWLLTTGWNLIIVARRPLCLPEGEGLAGWEAGTTCVVGRVGVAMSLIALMVSCTLFAILAVVSRPFEAHLFRYRHHPPIPTPTSALSRHDSGNGSLTSEKYTGRVSASTRRSIISNQSNTDVETFDLNHSPPTSILSPSPVRSIGLSIFTNQGTLPPPAGLLPSRSRSVETLPPIFQPTAPLPHLRPPPRMSSLVAPSRFVPLSIPASYSASAWRAVHPPPPAHLASASRQHPHSLYLNNRHSRSLVSLTRPHRLSSATHTSTAWSSRSGSTGEDGRGSPSSSTGAGAQEGATSYAVAYAILNGNPMPQAPRVGKSKMNHMRRASAPIAGAAETSVANQERKAKGWRPQLQDQKQDGAPRTKSTDLSTVMKDVKQDVSNLEKELDLRLSLGQGLPYRKTRSMSPLRHSDIPQGPADISRTATLNRTPRNSQIFKSAPSGKETKLKRMTFEELKNKPLPKIAAL